MPIAARRAAPVRGDDSETSRVILRDAREAAEQADLPYAGTLAPEDAWHLFSQKHAWLVDVRTAEEIHAVGYVPHSLHVAWATGVNLEQNPRFVRELENQAARDDVILFLCRSGRRSAAAAEAATAAGFRHAFNVAEGFEGETGNGQRGWRNRGLPWTQD